MGGCISVCRNTPLVPKTSSTAQEKVQHDSNQVLGAPARAVVEHGLDNTHIIQIEQRLGAIPDLGNHPETATLIDELTALYIHRYETRGDIKDLVKAVSDLEIAISNTQEHGTLSTIHNDLGKVLLYRYVALRHDKDLKAAKAHVERAVDLMPENDPRRSEKLGNLDVVMSYKYEQAGSLDDLNVIISEDRQAADADSEGCDQRVVRSEAAGNTNDLNDAMSERQEADNTTRSSHASERDAMLDNSAQCHSARYERTGDAEDLAAAILHTDRAFQDTPRETAMNWPTGLSNLVLLCDRYKQTGDIADLEASISKGEEVVDATSKDHPDFPSRTCYLAGSLYERYMNTGDTVDLVQAIEIIKQAEAVRIKLDLPEDTALLSNLGLFLSEQYQRTGYLEDLETAIVKTKRAIDINATPSCESAVWLNNLGAMLARRYNKTGADNDLEAAISNAKEALHATPPDHPDHTGWQNNLGILLLRQYQLKGGREDLAAAVSSAEASVSSMPYDHYDRAAWVNNLGNAYWYQYMETKRTECLDAALNWFLEASRCSTSPPLQRISGARRAMRILHQRDDLLRAASVAREAILLLPRVCSWSLKYTDQHFAVSQTTGLVADACSIFVQVNMDKEALQAVEFGRGLTLGYLLDSRSDMSELKRMHPSLAESYERLRSKAFNQLDTHNPVRRNQCIVERREDLLRLGELEDHIRSIPGFEKFLMPPPVEELMGCATEGPIVVVNITDLGSHALIVTTSDIRTLPLPDATSNPPPAFMASLTSYAIGRERDVREFECETPQYATDLLSWLWMTCVKPIIETLPDHNDEIPRVWWIGTGAASSLPFHAAGLYDYDGSISDAGSLENCLDRVISSYTPSIKALGHSRKSAIRIQETGSSNLSALLVAMPATPGLRSLPGVLLERDAIKETMGDALSVKELTGPTAQEVLGALPDASIVHFACHGVSHINPTMSHLFLQKSGEAGLILDRLTVSAVLEASPQGKGWIAYLSACSTAEVKAKSIAEENIHIASAFQVAGFAHVIGSLWPANDDICARVAKLFYRSLVENREARNRNRAVAAALRSALLQIRKDYLDKPELWALYTHSGA